MKKQIPQYLGELEKHRIEELKSLNRSYLLYIIPLASLFGAITIANEGLAPFLFLIAMFSWLFIYAGIILRIKDDYQKKVKARVFDLVAKKQGLDLVYNSEQYIKEEEYEASNLFREHGTYGGEDLFTGTYRDYRIAFSELRVTKRVGKRTTTRFDGVFFTLEIPTMKGNLKVIQKDQLFDKSTEVNWRKVDPALLDGLVAGFSNEFKIWTEDVKTARYVVNTKLLPLLKQWNERFEEGISLAIKGNKLYFAWSSLENMFEMNIRSSLKDSSTTAKMLEEFRLCLDILGQLIDCSEEVYQQDLKDEDIVLGDKDDNDTYDSLIVE